MLNFLSSVVVLLALIVFISFFNEKITKFTYEISLMLIPIIVATVVTVIGITLNGYDQVVSLIESLNVFNIEEFLIDGVLCFMLFAGACHMRLLDFKKHAKSITLLAICATLISSVFYGLLFYLINILLGLGMTIPMCLMFGSIVAPTDPIAATSILKKFNLPKNINFLMEAESLFNDGVGVALFVCFSGMVTAESSSRVIPLMAKEIFGAVAVGLIVTIICFLVFKNTSNKVQQIFASILAVSTSYLACEHFGFSGAIASVVCGIMFSSFINYEEYKGNKLELEEFNVFWEILDSLFNSVLYVLLGLSFLHILQMEYVAIISLACIIINLIGRSSSVAISAKLIGKLPDNYNPSSFVKLLTWGGLKGGLSVALAMSTHEFLADEIYYIILGGTFAIVFFTTVIQGLTMPSVYKKIKNSIK